MWTVEPLVLTLERRAAVGSPQHHCHPVQITRDLSARLRWIVSTDAGSQGGGQPAATLPGECAFVNCVAPLGNAVAMKLLEPLSELGARPLNVLALEQLEALICQGAANLSAAERDWLLAVAEFDRREGWASWECVSCAAWLSWQVGLDLRAAREKVRVARALAEFSLISAAMGGGELSYSKVRAITRIAEPATEAALVEMALAGTTNHVERIVSAYRRAEQDELAAEQRQHLRRGLHHTRDEDGSLVITIRVPAEAGAVILSAVEQFIAPATADESGHIEPLAARRADAMVALAQSGATSDGVDRGSQYLVTIHVDADTLYQDDGAGRCDLIGVGDSISEPIGVPRATARRLACDGDVELVVEDHDGNPLYMGRRSRLVRGTLRRAVEARDGCCRFPGCTRRGRVEAHHALDWILGGRSDIDTVLLLCRFHHHRVHEGGWRVEAHPTNGFVFRSPKGRALLSSPPRLTGERDLVDAYKRTTRDGRCRWGGERLDLDLALTALFSRRDLAAALVARTPQGARQPS